jgi:hypothetical protein
VQKRKVRRKEIAKMQWELIVALVIAIPVILFPAAYIWYVNMGGVFAAVKKAREKRIKVKGVVSPEQEYESALTEALKRYPWHES